MSSRFCDLAIDIGAIVPHTAGVERVGKAYPIIKTKLRSRLKPITMHTLTHIFVNIKLATPQSFNDILAFDDFGVALLDEREAAQLPALSSIRPWRHAWRGESSKCGGKKANSRRSKKASAAAADSSEDSSSSSEDSSSSSGSGSGSKSEADSSEPDGGGEGEGEPEAPPTSMAAIVPDGFTAHNSSLQQSHLVLSLWVGIYCRSRVQLKYLLQLPQ